MISEELKIWAAGAFDGEGSALIEPTGPGIRSERKAFHVVVAVANSDPRMTTPIIEAWGGHYRANQDQNKYARDGCTRKRDFSVYFDYDEAKKFLVDIFPYLRVKGKDAAIVIRALCALPEQVIGTTGKKRVPRGTTIILKPLYEELRDLRSSSMA